MEQGSSSSSSVPWPTLLNPDSELNVAEFNDCVQALQNPNSVGIADQTLRAFAQQPGAYMRIDGVLRTSNCPEAQHIALGVLNDAVQAQWLGLDDGLRVGIRNFMIEFVYAVGTNDVALRHHRHLVVKAASTLISIARHEWPERWPSFVEEVLGSATGPSSTVQAAQNAMLIMQLLLEEIFECGAGRTMTTAWVLTKKAAIGNYLPGIFDLCFSVATARGVAVDTVARAFETLATLLPCLPDPSVIVEDARFAQLSRTLTDALAEPCHRIPAVKCLHELATLCSAALSQQSNNGDGPFHPSPRGSALRAIGAAPLSATSSSQPSAGSLHAQLVVQSFVEVVYNCQRVLDDYLGPAHRPPRNGSGGGESETAEETDEERIMNAMSRNDKFETFFQCVAIYATNVISDFLPTLLLSSGANGGQGHERGSSAGALVASLAMCMVNGGGSVPFPIPRPVAMGVLRWVSRLFLALAYHGHRESLKIAVDFWWLLGELMVRRRSSLARELLTELDDLEDIRLALIRNMARPEEVTIFEDEFGELQHQKLSDVESVQLYVTMREALIFVAHVDPKGMESNIMELLQRLVNRTEWSWAMLNSLCWSYGAISGAFKYDEEKTFFVNFVRNLLSLCHGMKGQANRAVIASGVMYVLGQYPQFLSGHPRFLRTVLNKLHDFFKEPFPGIKEMAVETLNKILSKCAGCLWTSMDTGGNNNNNNGGSNGSGASQQRQNGGGGGVPQAIALVMAAEETAMELNHHERNTFYEAMGYFAASAPTRDDAERVVAVLLDARCNPVVREAVGRATSDLAGMLSGYDDLRALLHCCRVIGRVAKTCGPCFLPEMSNVVFPAMTCVIPLFAERIAQVVETQGPAALQHEGVRVLKQIKREFLRITEHFVASTDSPQFLVESVFPHVFGFILRNYETGHPVTRDAEVLALVTAAVHKSGDYLAHNSMMAAAQQGGSQPPTGTVQSILAALFEPTVQLIAQRSEEWPEHRVHFFKLLDALTQRCFEPFLQALGDNAQIMDGIFWAVRHEEPRTSEIGCRTLILMLNRVSAHAFGAPFCERYLARIFCVALDVLLDRLHQQGTDLQCALLQRLFALLKFVVAGQAAHDEVLAAVTGKLAEFQTLSRAQIHAFVQDCFSLCLPVDPDENSVEVPAPFADRVRDLLVEVRIWNAEQVEQQQKRQNVRELEGVLEGLERPLAALMPRWGDEGGEHRDLDFEGL